MRIEPRPFMVSCILAVTMALLPMLAACSKWPQPSEPPEHAIASAAPSLEQSSTQPSAMSRPPFEKQPEAVLRQRLEPLAFEVTQRNATEPPFRNRYFNHHEEGIYVDVVSGEALFSSQEKFDSGTGWPSFTAPISPESVVVREDRSHGMTRNEVRSKAADSHLGHVFDDGPAPAGLRYCINSASLRFVPKDRLRAEGYGQYAALFDSKAPPQSRPQPSSSPAETNSCTAPRDGQSPGCRATLEDAYLAGGCFWGMQDILRKVPGIVQTEVGYMGGKTASPTYDDVHEGTTGHAETVHIVFDPTRLRYSELLENWFFRMHDPTTRNRQGNDVGTQYRSAIFVTSKEQRQAALAAIQQAQHSGRWKDPIVTEVVDAGPFTLAESYHQDYLVKHPGGYTCHYLR